MVPGIFVALNCFFKSLGWSLFAAMGLQLPFQEGQFRSQSHLTWSESVTVEVRVLDSQKSTWRRDLRTDNKEKHSSYKKVWRQGRLQTQTVHFLVLLGDAVVKSTPLTMPVSTITYKTDNGTQTLCVPVSMWEDHVGPLLKTFLTF